MISSANLPEFGKYLSLHLQVSIAEKEKYEGCMMSYIDYVYV